jgi:hypothetical protein
VLFYSGVTARGAGWTPALARIDERDGLLTLTEPWLHEIKVEAKAVPSKYGGERLIWSFVCPGTRRPCGYRCRVLYRPSDDLEYSAWACKKCRRIRFRYGHKDEAEFERFLRNEELREAANQRQHLRSPEFKREARIEMEGIFQKVNGCSTEESESDYERKYE